ncbi:MAG: tetratricopeptide repeat protein, partial [Deltaproteobacteria bacterium]
MHRPIVGLLLIAALGLLAYSNTFHVPFVFDDEPAITENRIIKDIGNFLANLDGYAYNPRRYVAYLTFAINYRFGGLDVTGYHAFNIVVHLVNAFLVFALVRLSFRTPFLKKSALLPFSLQIAFLSALLFAVHPVQTQAVTYIVQRMTSLATLFSLASICLYSRWRLDPEPENSSWNRSSILYASSLLSLVLAMRTKEIAFTVPILIILYEAFFFESMKWKSLVPVLLTLLIIPAGLINIGKPLGEILSDVSTVTRVKSELPRAVYLMTQIAVVATYLRLLFLPVNQNLDYDFPVERSLFSLSLLLSALVIVALLGSGIILFLRSRPGRRNFIPELRLASFGVAWFFITLLVESSIIPITDVIFEHRVYLPSAGFFIALSTVVITAGFRLESKVPRLRRALVAGLMVAAVALAAATFARNETWKDEVRLWTDVVAKSPRKGRPRYNLGLAFDRKGDLAEAMRHYVASISLDPYNGKAHDNLGTIFSKQGRFPEAIREFRIALALDPGDAAAMNNLGNVYANLGRPEDAVVMFREALASDPDNVDAYYNLGIVYGKTGDFEKAA